VAGRVAFDLGDAALFGTLLPTAAARRKVAAIAGAWALVAAGSYALAERAR
jgi:hypothetical protein